MMIDYPYAPCMECLPPFTIHVSSNVDKCSIHGSIWVRFSWDFFEEGCLLKFGSPMNHGNPVIHSCVIERDIFFGSHLYIPDAPCKCMEFLPTFGINLW